MVMKYWTPAAALLFQLVLTAPALAADPLFESNERLDVRISAPITELMRERPNEEELDGVLQYTDASGQSVEVDIEIRTRGNYRRQERTCPFAPLRLDFPKSRVDGTLFENQDKLKIVTHCRNAMQFEQAVIREYLVYRMFNLLTPLSYRVRALNVTWVDTDRDGRENQRFAFLIEHKERFARRTGLPPLETERGDAGLLDPAYANLVDVFQFFAGNTDYSPVNGARGEDCCHNTNLFGDPAGPVFAVPYDFDMSGLADAPYATPNPALEITSTRDRLYRGRCEHNDHLAASIAAIQAKKEALYALIDNEPDMNAASRRSIRRFLDRFFRLTSNPRAVDSEFVMGCRAAR